jgi:hypothetical protein
MPAKGLTAIYSWCMVTHMASKSYASHIVIAHWGLAQSEACDICGDEIVWTPSGEAKDANKPGGKTHVCPMAKYNEWVEQGRK